MPQHQLHHHHRRQSLGNLGGRGHAGDTLGGIAAAISSGIAEIGASLDPNSDPSPDPNIEKVKTSSQAVSVVFVTATPTFSGPIGGYTTMPPTTATTTSTPDAGQDSATTSVKSSTKPKPTPDTSTSLLDSIPATLTSSSASQTTSSAGSTGSPSALSSSSTSSISDEQAKSTGMSGGAKAGIAIGVILGIAALAALAFFAYRWKKSKDSEAYRIGEDEKNPFGDNHATHAPPLAAAPTAMATDGRNGAFSANSARGQDLEKSNPFGNHAAVPNNSEIPAPLRINTPGADSATLVAGSLAGPASATIAQRHNAPKPLDIKRTNSPIPTGPFMGAAAASPASSQFSMTSQSSNGPPTTNVHRVQLDFKPSMEDELELKAGQLVRLLHEYDDGWALCIRLDRSQQGVAPRTCLSTRPVKPRQNPPPGSAPQSAMRLPIQRPESPIGRSASPALAPGPSRGQPRSMSPGPYGGGPQQRSNHGLPPGLPDGRMRSNSTSDLTETRKGPVGPSPMNPNASSAMSSSLGTASTKTQASAASGSEPPRRKPVPGHAAGNSV